MEVVLVDRRVAHKVILVADAAEVILGERVHSLEVLGRHVLGVLFQYSLYVGPVVPAISHERPHSIRSPLSIFAEGHGRAVDDLEVVQSIVVWYRAHHPRTIHDTVEDDEEVEHLVDSHTLPMTSLHEVFNVRIRRGDRQAKERIGALQHAPNGRVPFGLGRYPYVGHVQSAPSHPDERGAHQQDGHREAPHGDGGERAGGREHVAVASTGLRGGGGAESA
mmetsp:Transcript_4062/g.8519  ORF Transcript_4062/g.8519 Transcript_4062/m.8519 type:complete len:221 (-) Transcript_4062:232-894(-)